MSESLRDLIARLAGAQKSRARGAPAYSIFVNRPVGRVLAAIAYKAGLTPNQVTGVSALFTFTGILLLALAPLTWWLGIVVWLLLALGYAWDSADGQVARLRGGGSLGGEWLDHFVDALKVSSLHAAVLVGMARFWDIPAPWLLVPLLFGVVATTTFFGMILNDLLRGKKGVDSAHDRGGWSPLRAIILLPTDYGFLCLVFALWGIPWLFLPLYTAVFAASAMFLMLAAVKWFHDISALDEESRA
ncbi:CDP-alcohol phosphatidyltransferase family protein [Microbacterium koreense]|uniref:CDP-alcohol phosphatidyltransferase family protein n=1 Tax=Microbacterium koreense TaxID=323761 RepID=A0ABW2ZNY9_9MICO